MNDFQIFFNININQKKIDFIITSTNEPRPIFFKNSSFDTPNKDHYYFRKSLELILKKIILQMEKEVQIVVEKVNLMIEDEKLNTIEVTLNENFENKSISKTSIEYLLQDIKQQIEQNHPEKKIVHIIIKKCLMDGEEYSYVPLGVKCKIFIMDISFIYLKKSILSELEILLKNHQIEINRTICTNYAKSLLNFDIDDLPRAGMAALSNNNLNEVEIYSKKITKLGFFEKLFHIFT